MSSNIRDRHWSVLLDTIKDGNCIPVLGPGVCVAGAGGARRKLAVELSRALAEILVEDKQKDVHEPSALPLVAQIFQNEFNRDELVTEVKAFYDRYAAELAQHQDPVFERLAALPFPLFVTSRHDRTLTAYLERQGKRPKLRGYHLRGDNAKTLRELGTIEEPVVYTMHGSYEDRSSLVITENDILDFMRAVIASNPGLPVDLLNLFRNQNFLFLGFGLHDPHLRLLLHALDLSKMNMSFALESTPVAESKAAFDGSFQDSVLFYSRLGYDALKLMNLDFDAFVKELHDRWIERHPTGVGPDAAAGPGMSATPAQRGADEGPKVFISYVEEDRTTAERLVQRLREEGLNPWIDKEGLRFGTQWSNTLEDTVSKQVDYFVVLQSRALSERKESYVFKEVKIALERQSRRPRRFIFPVQIDDDGYRIDAIEREKIQTGPLYDWNADVKALASEIQRDFETA